MVEPLKENLMALSKKRLRTDIMNLFFDCETTGTYPKDYATETHYKWYPYICSIAWNYANKNHYYLVHQEGRKIPEAATEIHGITTQMGNNDSICKPIKWVLGEFIKDAVKSANVINHNVFFDVSIIKANVYREFGLSSVEAEVIKQALHKEKRICTMKGTMGMFNGRWPKLTALHEYLFKKAYPAHDAMEDVMATQRCYYELKRLKKI